MRHGHDGHHDHVITMHAAHRARRPAGWLTTASALAARGAAQAARLAVAGLSGRRLPTATAWNGRSRTARVTDAARSPPGSPTSSATAPAATTRSSSPAPGARPTPATTPRCGPVAELAAAFQPSRSATWKRPRRAAPSSPPSRGLAERPPRALAAAFAADAIAALPGRRRALPPPPTASRPRRRSPPCSTPSSPIVVSAGVRAIPIGQTDGQRVIAALGAGDRRVMAAAAAAAIARRSRRRGAQRRHRLHEARNPVHEAVPLMTSPTTALCASASAGRSAPARPR